MLKTLRSTESTTRPGKGGVGVDDDSGDDSGHDIEHSPRGLGRAYQRTHQLVRPGLWLNMMRLIEVGVVLLVSRSKSRQKSLRIAKKFEKPQRPEKLQRSSVRKNVYQSTNPPELELTS